MHVVDVNKVNYPTGVPGRPFSHFKLVTDVDQFELLICCNDKLSPKISEVYSQEWINASCWRE